MKQKLIYFLSQYGNDFFHKLPKYKTAKLGDKFVSLCAFDPETLQFRIPDGKGFGFPTVDLFDLDEFCL